MPLTYPALDDLTYATVETMLRERIALVAPEWTDHNKSDPGIAMIQLFAYLTEQVGYRLNRVPEKTYVEFLRLLGIRLAPAVAAKTRLAFTLTKPARADGVLVPAGAQITAKASGGEPPVFETDAPLDVLPAQIAALVTTRDKLTTINAAGESLPVGGDAAAYAAERFSIAWDGKTPKLKDMPNQPVPLFSKPTETLHTTLYIGLAFNQSASAGFKGARASLYLQTDHDEEPEPDASVIAGEAPLSIVNAVENGPTLIEYEYFRPATVSGSSGTWQTLPILSDETDAWNRSGAIRFEVPLKIGPIPAGSWTDVAAGVPHPLIGALKTPIDDTPADVPISGWLRVTFAVPPKISVRALSFNTAVASDLKTVVGERLGRGTGRPGQVLTLSQPNIAAGTLNLVSRDPTRTPETVTWREVPDFDATGPNDAVYALDCEAGAVIFGDAIRGRPPLITDRIVANYYRHGGGIKGEVATGAVNQPSGLPPAIGDVFNVLPARGGRDAEKMDAAKARAPRTLRSRGRAVTAADFEDAALAAPGVKIARATVIPLHRPYPQGRLLAGHLAPGIDMDTEAAGTLSVIVVPQMDGAYPLPTTGELTAVAAHLDTVRLLTTEVHVTTPQYVRLYDIAIMVRGAAGYSTTSIREGIADTLRRRFHVLTGGVDGKGYPFGAGLHHGDLVAATMRVPGVDRVESLACMVDGRTPDGAEPAHLWRIERRLARRLASCQTEEDESQVDKVILLPDEVPFVDVSSLTITVVGAP